MEVSEELKKIINDYGAQIVDMTNGCFVIELTDSPQVLDKFLEDVNDFEIIEMCRSGAIAMERGNVSYDIN